jgi:hypothetical protein
MNSQADAAIERPVFVVRQSWLTTILGVALSSLFGILIIISGVLGGSLLHTMIGIAFLGAPVLTLILAVFYTDRYEFYENYFKRIYRGSVRNEIRYSRTHSRFFSHTLPRRYTSRNRIILTVVQNGQELPFVIDGNPRNKEIGMKLNDWLENKIASSGGRI